MVDGLELITQHLKNQSAQPPIEKWHPPLSGDIDILIKSNGDWIHEGRKIERHSLLKLFFSILRYECDGEYYLVTPVEKWRIRVEEFSCLVVDMDVVNRKSEQQQIIFTTNIERKYLLSQSDQLNVRTDAITEEPLPSFKLPHGLSAKLSRSVFYRLIDISEEKNKQLYILSDKHRFVIGDL